MAIEVQGLAPMVQVFDMPRSIRFYRDVLGFTVTERSKAMSDDPDDVNWAMLRLSNATIMLNTAYDPDDVPEAPDAGRWSGHQDTCLYFGCPDVDGAYQHLVAQGFEARSAEGGVVRHETALFERPRWVRYLLPVVRLTISR